MNFPTTFHKVKIDFKNGSSRLFEQCQMIITGDYLIINKEPQRPDENTKIVSSEIFNMGEISEYATTKNLPEDYKGLITD